MPKTRVSIAQVADAVLAEVRAGTLTKLAEHDIVAQETKAAAARSELARGLSKLASLLRSKDADVTVAELRNFIAGLSQ